MTHEDYVKYAPNFGMRPEFYNCTLEKTERENTKFNFYQRIFDWPVNSGKGFYLFGGTGVGKSHALKIKANILVHYKIDCIVERALFPRYPQWIELTNYLKDIMPNGSFDKDRGARIEKYINDVENADWLFIDDFGATTKTEWAIDQVFKLIDARVANQKQTFISSNLAPADVLSFYGERIQSRLMELCTFIRVEGEDRRRRM